MVYARGALSMQGMASGMAAHFLNFAVIEIGAVGCLLGGLMSDRWGRTATTTGMLAGPGLCAVLIGFAFNIWLLPAIAYSHGGWRWVLLVLVPGLILGAVAMATLRRLPEAGRFAGGRR